MEPLEELQEIAFRRGVGISRRNALKSEDFHSFHAASRHGIKVPGRETYIQLEYLGGRLADRAFKNLPVRLQRMAYGWNQLSMGEQQDALEDIVLSLESGDWYYRRGLQHDDSIASTIFPNESKTWSRGKQPPNCLGMIQMLVGFARAAGEKHLVATPLVPTDYLTARFHAFGYEKLIECLEPHSDLAPVRRVLREWHRAQRRWYQLFPMYDERNGQAHHGLLLRGKGRRWHYVDPYFRTLSSVSSEDNPRMWRDINTMLRRRSYLVHGMAHGVDSMSELASLHLDLDRTIEMLEAVVRCIRTPRDAQRILIDADMELWYKPLPYARSRELSAYYAEWLDLGEMRVSNMASMTRNFPPAVEVGHAETTLAAFVMNHVAVQNKTPDIHIYNALGSQYIIKDQIALGLEDLSDDYWYNFLPSWAILPSLREQALLAKSTKEEG